MKKITILIIFLLSAIQIQAQEEKKEKDIKVNWISFEKAVELNKKDPKPLLINVYADWCGYCKKMGRTTYKNDTIVKYINDHFYTVKLNGEQKEDLTYNDYTFKYKASGRRGYHEFAAAILDGKLSYPTTVFMNKEMQLLDRVPGYLNPQIMEQVVTYFASGKYQTDAWADYVKNFKSNL